MADELLPCPFCGNEAIVEYRCLAYEVRCQNNKCPGYSQAYYSREEEAVAAWNKRAPAPGVPKEVAETISWSLSNSYSDISEWPICGEREELKEKLKAALAWISGLAQAQGE